jgi:hypothetical protein
MSTRLRIIVIFLTLSMVSLLSQSINKMKAYSQEGGTEKMEKSTKCESPIACFPKAMDVKQRERHHQLMKQLRANIEEIRELSDGYELRLSSESSVYLEMAEFITLERLCCPFFNFVLELKPEGGPLWLRITGREGIKDIVQSEFVNK